MNKKRVALALAAALGINTLMVTVGQVGEQMTVAHATQASGRLTTEQDEARRKAITIKQLDTTATNLANGNVEVTFNNVRTTDIKEVTSTAFEHKKFTEREKIDGTNGTVTPRWANGKLTFNGIKEAGIYTGTVTIDYNNGDKETYTLSLTKKANDTLELGKVDVTAGSIKISDVKFNGQSFNGGETLYLVEKGGSVTSTTPKATYDATNGALFSKGINFKEGQVYEVVYQYADKLHEVSAQLMLTKQEKADVVPFATNDAANFKTSLETKLQSDFGVAAASVAVPNPANYTTNSTASYEVKVDNEKITGFQQTVGNAAANVAGAELRLTPSTDASLKISVSKEPADSGNANYVEKIKLTYGAGAAGTNTPNTDGYIGSYYFKIDGKENVYFKDNSSSLTISYTNPAQTGGTANSNKVFLDAKPALPARVGFDGNVSQTLNLDHGYTSVQVEFGVGTTFDIGTVKTEIANKKQELDAGTPTPNPVYAVVDPTIAPANGKAGVVKTAVVVSTDRLDASIVSAEFVKTSDSTGELVLKNAQSLFPTNFNPNDAVSKLSVLGATKVGLVADGSKTDLRFAVEYNGKLPSTINWTFTVDNKDLVSSSSSFGGTLETSKGAVETVSFRDTVTTSNSNTNNIKNQFELVAAFGNSVPTGATVGFEGQNNLRVTFDELGRGNKTIKATVGAGSKYQGTYSAGIWVTQQPFTIEVKDPKSTSNTSATVVVDANFINKDDIAKVEVGVIQYSEKVVNGNTTTWTDWKDSSTKVEKSEVKEDAITKTVTGLTGGKTYKFRAVYDYNNGTTTEKVYSTISGEVTLPTSSSNSTITGSGSSSSTTGTSTGSTTISVNTNNSTLSGTSASVKLPSGFRYDSSKTPVAVTFKYKDKDGKVVTETKEQFSNVTAKFNGDNVEVNGLVPGKNYDEITVDYTDNNGRTRSIVLRNIQTTATVESDKYLANVYTVVFNRPADEAGYHFHLDNLKNKRVSLREFLLNMLSEKEFIEKYKSTEQKVEALYSAIVARDSDEAGKKFWVEEYNKALKVYGSESTALRAIADRMVNENELKELADKMGVQW